MKAKGIGQAGIPLFLLLTIGSRVYSGFAAQGRVKITESVPTAFSIPVLLPQAAGIAAIPAPLPQALAAPPAAGSNFADPDLAGSALPALDLLETLSQETEELSASGQMRFDNARIGDLKSTTENIFGAGSRQAIQGKERQLKQFLSVGEELTELRSAERDHCSARSAQIIHAGSVECRRRA